MNTTTLRTLDDLIAVTTKTVETMRTLVPNPDADHRLMALQTVKETGDLEGVAADVGAWIAQAWAAEDFAGLKRGRYTIEPLIALLRIENGVKL